MTNGDPVRSQAACEAALLLGEAIRELLIPQHLSALADKWEAAGAITGQYSGAIRHSAVRSAIIGVARVKEVEDHFLVPWVFAADELRGFGLDVEAFVHDWRAFLMVRNQWSAHSTTRKERSGRQPNRIISARALGRAIRRTGIGEDNFLLRVREDLVPAVERVRDELLARYPGARDFITVTYPKALEAAINEPDSP